MTRLQPVPSLAAIRAGRSALAVVFALTWAMAAAYGGETALDRYVKKPDPTYGWRVVREVKGDGFTQFIVELKSQTWRSSEESSSTVWRHWVNVVRPDKLASSTAFLFISGGSIEGEAPQSADERTLAIAKGSQTVAVELRMVPNQPLVFHNDGTRRGEDDLIGYTWDQFLKTGDENWPARLPMVKSAVRAMDCIQELLASEQGGGHKIEKFVVGGGSKRGWTTWCTAAVDPRVRAAVPIVIDVLNLRPQIEHHAAVYGFYSHVLDDYLQHNILQRMDDPKMDQLMAIEDPYSYRDRFTMPKYVVNASGDQFFCPDSSQFYYDDLPGEKHLRYVPNADHSLRESDALEGIIAFYQMVLAGRPRPTYGWTLESDGSIKVTVKDRPAKVLLWQATNSKARDFRVETIGRTFSSGELSDQGGGVYIGRIEPPSDGWTAFFVELHYESGGPFPLKVSTAVRILPDRLPHADLDPKLVPLEVRKE